ncbi:hypothetical protein H696_00524 [Fonticula alba]|uniref:Ubiquitin carboxyl-terminal hydrolase n=1 Tax=Fonticula alba TaxID=691883 RepID=A0A058ZGA7_FONAL|nr:hypothetical protein H696_00524 [Fonticula alba]KCV72971.1 hypothetical protein H696_00524 [Fonticula alba]|eukprot:XP_009492672.1 hypothetical protein H696_00524 [Fonticula alba]
MDQDITQQAVYLHLVSTPKKPESPESAPISQSPPPEKRPRVLGIGVEGGFPADEPAIVYEDHHRLVFAPDFDGPSVPFPCADIPADVTAALEAILKATSAGTQQLVDTWVADQSIAVSKFAENLEQLDNGVRVPPTGWKCSKCDLTENLWMNLTDGAILCGRRNWDGTGGNGHALEHFEATRYPLCVKLGTISSNMDGIDVYSYAEDDMVRVPALARYLAHFGIRVQDMTKSESTISELEIERNMQLDFDVIQESGQNLQPLYGPGFTGLKNFGNSCYLSSALQALFHTDPFARAYFGADNMRESLARMASLVSLEGKKTAMAKAAHGLLSGRYSPADKTSLGPDGAIAPVTLKTRLGRGHAEFSTGQQQDAMELIHHLLESLGQERQRLDTLKPAALMPQLLPEPHTRLQFQLVSKLQCMQSEQVKFTTVTENCLSLHIPLSKADAVAAEPGAPAAERPVVPLLSCLSALNDVDVIEDYLSPVTKARGPATQFASMLNFPDVLVLQMQRFAVDDNWQPVKVDALIDVPLTLDLGFLRGTATPGPGETLLPEEDDSKASDGGADKSPAATGPRFSPAEEAVIAQLLDLGFGVNPSRRAVVACRSTAGGVPVTIEQATDWYLSHMDDMDFDQPLPEEDPAPAGAVADAAPGPALDDESIAMLMSLGIERNVAERALRECGGDIERSAEWSFTHGHDMPPEAPPKSGGKSGSATAAGPLTDGQPVYRLRAFVSHMGRSAASGHYVCHVRVGDDDTDCDWVIFNDSHVALSQNPPLMHGYLYVYERADSLGPAPTATD